MGVLFPPRFIQLAEGAGAIHEIGEWILREACGEAKRWPDEVSVAVNVSSYQLCDRSILRVVEKVLDDARLPPSRLQVEITASALAGLTDGTAALAELSARGASIILDDFGAGRSSFDHVRWLPIDGLKIDSALVAALPFHRKAAAIVHGVGHLARALDLEVVAKGIESAVQLEFLRQARFELGQGDLFAPPQTGDALIETLRACPPSRQDVA